MFKQIGRKIGVISDPPIRLNPVVSQREVDPNTQLPYYLSELKYGEVRERYRHLNKPVVCVLDNGMHDDHEDLVGKIVEQIDFTGESLAFKGLHGSHVGGIISGNKYGLSDNVPLANYKVLTYEGSGTLSSLIRGIKEADKKGYQILNLSLGSDYPNSDLESAILDFTKKEGNFVVIAAGNDGRLTDYPAAYASKIPGVISVGAADTLNGGHKQLADFSSRGTVTVTGQGVDVISTGVFWDGVHKYMYMSGTSMAAPFVASLISLANEGLGEGSTAEEKEKCDKNINKWAEILKYLRELILGTEKSKDYK